MDNIEFLNLLQNSGSPWIESVKSKNKKEMTKTK